MQELIEGSKAPSFKLNDSEGKSVSLSDFLGKSVILYFYPKDNTPGCTKEASDFKESIKKITNASAVVLGISPDSEASHKKFRGKFSLPFILLSDPDKKVSEKYGVYKEKKMYGKTHMGIERSTFVIDPSGKIKSIFRKVKVDGHVEKILEVVK